MSESCKAAKLTLHVIMADDSPLHFAQDPPTHRHIAIELTPQQCVNLARRKIGVSGGVELYERISQAFLQEESRDA